MGERLNLLKEARAARNLASRVLKGALRVSDDVDKARLRKHAEHLRQQASDLELRAASVQDVPIF